MQNTPLHSLSSNTVRRPLFRRVLLLNLILAPLLAGGAVLTAFIAVGKAVEASARTDIEAEIRILDQHGELHQGFGYAEAIDFRILPEEDAKSLGSNVQPNISEKPSLSVYLLARSDMSPVVGNLKKWPDGLPNKTGWQRFDGASASVAPGTIIAKVKSVQNGRYTLIVGRRLATYDALYRQFIPVMIAIALIMAGTSAFFTNHIARIFSARVNELNAVFRDVRSGAVKTRVPTSSLREGDELAILGSEVNTSLDEISRLMKGLDAVSQTAAHELNKEIERLQVLAHNTGETSLADGAGALQQLLREILELARIESATGYDMRAINITDAADQAVKLYEETYKDKGVKLSTNYSLPELTILGRAPLITNMIANLLNNALKHTPKGGEVTVTIKAKGETLSLMVTDTGPGTDTEDIADLIARGARGPVAGYGFGLRFVQAVAIRHGARLSLQNQGPGLSVVIMFPQKFEI